MPESWLVRMDFVCGGGVSESGGAFRWLEKLVSLVLCIRSSFGRSWRKRLGLRIAPIDDLTILEQSHHPHAAADISRDRRNEPLRLGQKRSVTKEDCGEDLSAGRDAVGETSQADDKGEHPDDHDRSGDGMRSGDQPGHGGDDPPSNDAAPEDSGRGRCAASSPSHERALTTSGRSAPVKDASVAKVVAPRMFAGRTIPQSFRVFQTCRFSARTSATGYRVFSVKSCERPRITAMKPSG